MAGKQVKRQPLKKLLVAVVENQPIFIEARHHSMNIMHVEGRPKMDMAHRSPGGESNFLVLNVVSRIREIRETAGMIIVKMRKNDVFDTLRRYPDFP